MKKVIERAKEMLYDFGYAAPDKAFESFYYKLVRNAGTRRVHPFYGPLEIVEMIILNKAYTSQFIPETNLSCQEVTEEFINQLFPNSNV